MSKRTIANFTNGIRPIIDGLPFLEQSSADRHHAVVALARAAGSLIELEWHVSLPSPEISAAFLETVATRSLIIANRRDRLALDTATGCWLMPLSEEYDSKGRARYPTISSTRHGFHSTGMHRAVFIDVFGPVDSNIHLDHLCRKHACCSPLHIEPVTCAVNASRGREARQSIGGAPVLPGITHFRLS